MISISPDSRCKTIRNIHPCLNTAITIAPHKTNLHSAMVIDFNTGSAKKELPFGLILPSGRHFPSGRDASRDALYLLFKIPCERKRNLPKGLCPQSRRRDKPWAEGKVPPPDSQLSFTSQRISSSSTRYCFNSSGPQELEPTPLIP